MTSIQKQAGGDLRLSRDVDAAITFVIDHFESLYIRPPTSCRPKEQSLHSDREVDLKVMMLKTVVGLVRSKVNGPLRTGAVLVLVQYCCGLRFHHPDAVLATVHQASMLPSLQHFSEPFGLLSYPNALFLHPLRHWLHLTSCFGYSDGSGWWVVFLAVLQNLPGPRYNPFWTFGPRVNTGLL